MNIIDASEVRNMDCLVSIDDLSMYLFLMHRDLVDLLLEFITIFTDDEMIQEIVNTLNFDVTGVMESGVIVGYITPGSVRV